MPPGHIASARLLGDLYGVLLKHGNPTRSLFSGLLQLENGQRTRFVELITIRRQSLDPLAALHPRPHDDYLGPYERQRPHRRWLPRNSEEATTSDMQLAKMLEYRRTLRILKIGRPPGNSSTSRFGKAAAASSHRGLIRSRSSRRRGIPFQITPGWYMEYTKLFPFSELPDRI
jgi:hypothetical protein